VRRLRGKDKPSLGGRLTTPEALSATTGANASTRFEKEGIVADSTSLTLRFPFGSTPSWARPTTDFSPISPACCE
jgi:hypothetical protein